MKRCDPNARAKCPDGKRCELYAEFSDGSECDKFNQQMLSQPMTNADRIRAMSDEELARMLYDCDSLGYCNSPPECAALLDTDEGILAEKCIGCVLAWLQQPVKEATL